MQESFVQLNTAKLAREKGCEETTDNIWFPKEREWLQVPTQSLLQKWLREVHEIHIYVTTTSLGDYAVFITDSYDKHLISNERMYNNAIHCSYTYEEALEVGLQESLKLIKTNNND